MPSLWCERIDGQNVCYSLHDVEAGVFCDADVAETRAVVVGASGVESMIDLSIVPWQVPDGRSLGRVERLELVQADPNAMAVVCQRVIDGESLREIARAWELPTLRFAAWVSGDPERLAAYEGALRVRADELAHQVLGVADDAAGEVPRDALRVKTRLQLAGFWDRERYGAGAGVSGKRTRVVVDRTCGVAGAEPQTDRVAIEIEE